MKRWKRSAVLLIFLLLPCASFGEIYGWVDENGVKHYSNDPPPEGVKAISQTAEITADPMQDAKREESDRQALQELNQQEPEGEAPPEPAESAAAEPTATESEAEPTVTESEAEPTVTESVEKQDDEAFHRERIKRRTRQNTSPSPGLK